MPKTFECCICDKRVKPNDRRRINDTQRKLLKDVLPDLSPTGIICNVCRHKLKIPKVCPKSESRVSSIDTDNNSYPALHEPQPSTSNQSLSPVQSSRFKEPNSTMDIPLLDDNADYIDVTCGLLQARLHRQRFICPGINRDCIEYDGKLMTPKTFYILADKGSLKDWKNAIRINGKKIRRYIDSGILDFYNHKDLCTGRCKSRLGNKTSLLPMDLQLPTSSGHSTISTLDTSLNTDSGFNSSNESLVSDGYGEISDIKPDVEHLNAMMGLEDPQTSIVTRITFAQPNESLVTDGFGEIRDIKPDVDHLNAMMGLEEQTSEITPVTFVQPNEDDDEDQTFWRAIVQLGLIDEFFREIKTKLDTLKVGMIKNFVNIDDAKKASLIVHELGMRNKLDLRLGAHKTEFDKQRLKLEKEMEQLKKKVSEYEQKQQLLKQKSDCYASLLSKKLKPEDEVGSTFMFETSTGSAMVVSNPEFTNSDSRSRSRSVSPVADPSSKEVSLIQKQRESLLVSKKRKNDDKSLEGSPASNKSAKLTKSTNETEEIVERKADNLQKVLQKVLIDTPRGPTAVFVNNDVDSESSRATSPFPTMSQETCTETSLESSSQESSVC